MFIEFDCHLFPFDSVKLIFMEKPDAEDEGFRIYLETKEGGIYFEQYKNAFQVSKRWSEIKLSCVKQ